MGCLGTGGRAAGIHGSLAQRLGLSVKKSRRGALRLGRIHRGNHLIKLGREALKWSAAVKLEFLVLTGRKDDEFAAIVAGNREGAGGGKSGDLAEFIFEDAGRDFGQLGNGRESDGMRSGNVISHE